MKKITSIGLLLSCMVGCTTVAPPSSSELAAADYGAEISITQFNKLAQGYLRANLIDPNSLMFHPATHVQKYWIGQGKENYYGYFGCYDYNAKNRMGGYSGKRQECLFARDGRIMQIYTVYADVGNKLKYVPQLENSPLRAWFDSPR